MGKCLTARFLGRRRWHAAWWTHCSTVHLLAALALAVSRSRRNATTSLATLCITAAALFLLVVASWQSWVQHTHREFSDPSRLSVSGVAPQATVESRRRCWRLTRSLGPRLHPCGHSTANKLRRAGGTLCI